MIGIIIYFVNLFRDWLLIFLAPLKNSDMLWIIIPIYLGWFTAEFFQEKRGTSLGNAISNGVIPLWASADWMRTLLRSSLYHDALFYFKVLLAAGMFAYGLYIIVSGIKAKEQTKFIGRIHVVTYVMIMLTPIFYGTIKVSFDSFLAMLLFSPLFYFIIEAIDVLVPDPRALSKDSLEATLVQQKQYQPAYPVRQPYQFPRQRL